MIINENNIKSYMVLKEAAGKSSYRYAFPQEDIMAAMIISESHGVSVDDVLLEAETGAFGKMFKKIKSSLKKAGETAKYSWAKNAPELYGQGTHKFWQRKELAQKAAEELKNTQDALDNTFGKAMKKHWDEIKTELSKIQEPPAKGELGFPNVKRSEDFWAALFGLGGDWDRIEKELKKIESGGKKLDPEFGGVFGKMFAARLAMQAHIDNMVEPSEEQIQQNLQMFNKFLAAFRKILQKYAQDVKEIYQTFENTQLHYGSMSSLLFEEVDLEQVDDYYDMEALEDVLSDSDSAISAKQLQSLKTASNPMGPLIAGLILGITGALGMKMSMDDMQGYIDMYSKIGNSSTTEITKKITTDLLEPFKVQNGEGLTQLVGRLSGTDAGDIRDMSLGDFTKLMQDKGFTNETFGKILNDPEAAAELLKKGDPSTSVKDFFVQASKTMSGKTGASPFMLKKAGANLVTKAAKTVTKKAITKVGAQSVAAYAGAGLGTAVLSTLAAGTGLGLLTVAALRKFKSNRKKLMLTLIDSLKDVEGPSQDSTTLEVIDTIDNNPTAPDVMPTVPGPNEVPTQEGGEDGGSDDDGEGDGEDNQNTDGPKINPTDPTDPINVKGCEQTEAGLLKFMQDYNNDTSWSTKPGDGKPKKMSTIFDPKGKLDRKFAKAYKDDPASLRKDLAATAEKYNDLLGNEMYTVSDDEEVVAQTAQRLAANKNIKGNVLLERWNKLAGIKD